MRFILISVISFKGGYSKEGEKIDRHGWEEGEEVDVHLSQGACAELIMLFLWFGKTNNKDCWSWWCHY